MRSIQNLKKAYLEESEIMCSDKILNVCVMYGVKPWGGDSKAKKQTIYLKTKIITRTSA